VTRYSRQDVIRILHLQGRQLVAWERAGLVPALGPEDAYTFEHLSQLRALREMHATRISSRSIRASFDAARGSGMRNPLMEASAVHRGGRLAFRHGGALMDPMTQQLAFDFETATTPQLHMVRAGDALPDYEAARLQTQVQEFFLRAVRLEEDPNTVAEARGLYEQILAIRPEHAPASINLGTIYYHQRDFARAEQLYRHATVADPDYALAFFDLGNVLDEMQRLPEAVAAYQRAVEIVPGYADAHYNLALAFERQGERRRALRHWMSYARLDPVGPWAAHAKVQARKILSTERLEIVSRRGHQVLVAG
jgi:tetratricopeptide (TPR) repeat protein